MNQINPNLLEHLDPYVVFLVVLGAIVIIAAAIFVATSPFFGLFGKIIMITAFSTIMALNMGVPSFGMLYNNAAYDAANDIFENENGKIVKIEGKECSVQATGIALPKRQYTFVRTTFQTEPQRIQRWDSLGCLDLETVHEFNSKLSDAGLHIARVG